MASPESPTPTAPAGAPKWRVLPNSCRCHPETCPHWAYYVTDGQEQLGGTDSPKVAQHLCDKLNGVTAPPTP